MIKTELTKEQTNLLKAIINDRFSIGAFSGMIYNQVKDCDDWTNEIIDIHIQLALKIRLRMIEIVEGDEVDR